MDWRFPNVGCVFHKEQNQPKDLTKYARSVKNPLIQGLCSRDYDSDHRPRIWPYGTEYQFAYCSNYRVSESLTCDSKYGGITYPVTRSLQHGGTGSGARKLCHSSQQQFFNKLYEVTPLPVIDEHQRGGRYVVGEPIGTRVPVERSGRKETAQGIVGSSCQADLENMFTPNYRYKEWVSRPMIHLYNELESNRLFCRLPESKSQYWDFYNVVRMHRPAKKPETGLEFVPSRIMPLPMDKAIPDLPPLSSNPHLGKLNKYRTMESPFVDASLPTHVLGMC